jgi:hypothetical protein
MNGLKLPDGRDRLVRRGRIQTGIGAVEVAPGDDTGLPTAGGPRDRQAVLANRRMPKTAYGATSDGEHTWSS